jgi:hypothetical protein
MELDEKPTEDYSDIGGLDKQIQELIEAVVRPMTHAHLFKNIGIRAPKGVLLYGPPGKWRRRSLVLYRARLYCLLYSLPATDSHFIHYHYRSTPQPLTIALPTQAPARPCWRAPAPPRPTRAS